MERKMKKILVLLTMVLLVLAMAGCGQQKVDSAPSLSDALTAEGTATIELTEDLVLTEPVVINGNKVITGPYTITLSVDGEVQAAEGPGFSLLGCPKLTAEDWSADASVLQVAEGASLTLEGETVVDGAGVSNGIVVHKNGTLNITEDAVIQNGLNCNVYVCEGANLNVSGGSVLNGLNHGVVNLGTMNVTGGILSGTEAGAVIYNAGALDISEGKITAGGVHNIYAAAGTVNVTGGMIDWAAKDGIVTAAGASATVTGGAIENCGTHGLCNGGTMETGAIVLYECGIANQAGGTLNMTDTTVEISPVYCLANMGGTVNAKNFSALSCDVTSVCNFAGDMTLENLTVSGSRAGNISNESGNLTVNTATLGLCREKPINVGSGVVRMDNITVEGTTGEYFGAFIYGGEFYLSNSTINFINYSALRADGKCYVELNNVTVDDTMASGIWSRGATIVANKLTLNNIRGHAINNAGGNITITDMKATNIGKNAIIQDNGVTTLNSVSFQHVGDQGAYVKNGTLNINDAWFDDVAENGVYSVPTGEGIVVLKDVTYSRVAKYGLNNGHGLSAYNVTILCNSGTGILNKQEMYLENVKVTGPTKDCIYNDKGAYLFVKNVLCEKAGKGSSVLFNRGEVEMHGLTIKDSENGLINKETGLITGQQLEISGIENYGIRNQGKVKDVTGITISNTGNHGINNEMGSQFVASDIVISDTQGEEANGIYNYAADMLLTNLTVNGGKSHGIFNRGTIIASQVTVNNSGEVGYYNYDDGFSDITDLTVNNSGNHAVCNFSQMHLTNALVNGTKSGCGIMNGQIEEKDAEGNVTKVGKAGQLELSGAVSLSGTASHGIANVQHSTLTGAADVNIQNTANTSANGIYNRGSDMTVGNISITGYKYGVSNTGNMNVASVTVSGTANDGIYNTGNLNATGDVTVSKVTAGRSIYSKGGVIDFSGTVTVNGVSGKDAVVADVGSTINLNNAVIKSGNNAMSAIGGDIFANNVTVDGSTIGINIRNANSEVTVSGTSTISNTTHGSAVHVNNGGKLSINGGSLTVNSKASQVGVNVYASSTLELVGGTLIVNNAKKSLNVNGTVNGDAASVINVVNNSGAEHGIYINGTFNMNGTVNVSGAAAADLRLIEVANGTVTIGTLNRADTTAREVLRANNASVVTVNSGTVNGGSGKDVVVASGSALITLNNMAITGGNNALHGAGGDIIANNVTIDGSTIGINIRNANSEITVRGTSSISGATHGSAVHVNSKGKLSIEGNLTINCTSGKNGVKVYNGSTLNMAGGSLIINNPKTGISTDAGAIITGTADSSITINNVSADGFAIENYGTITMNGTVSGTGAASSNALFKMLNNATFGALNVPTASAREMLRAEKSAVVTVNGGTINGSSKDVVVASETSVINVNNVAINGGNNMLYGAGGDIHASNVTLTGGTIGVNIRNANSEVTFGGTNTVTNTTHGTCLHINSTGKLSLKDGASLTLQWTNGAPKVGMKIYKNSTFAMGADSKLTMIDCQKGWNTEAGYTFSRGEGAVVIVNGEEK